MIPQRARVRCESGETQIIKWTAEGAVKCGFIHRVFCDVSAYVSCREYDGTL